MLTYARPRKEIYMPTPLDPLYQSQRWRKIVRQHLASDPSCRLRMPGCTLVATCVDHITSPYDGGDFWHPANRQSACVHCNSVKANKARAERRRRNQGRNNSREW